MSEEPPQDPPEAGPGPLLAQVQARLRAECDALRHVSGAVDFARLSERDEVPPKHRQPAAYVVPLADQATESARASWGVRQTVTSRIGVILVTSDAADGRGDAAAQDIDAVQRAVREALLGWLPDGYDREAHCAGGRSLGYARGAVWWMDEYTVQEIVGRF